MLLPRTVPKLLPKPEERPQVDPRRAGWPRRVRAQAEGFLMALQREKWSRRR